MQLNQTSAEKMLADMGMDDLPVIAVRPVLTPVAPDWFAQYKKLCKQFMTSLSDSVQELAFMNLPQDEFIGLMMGRTLPDNLSFRFRIPLTWGGKLELDNMFMCWTFPHSQNMDRFIISQSGNDTIWLPNPEKKIYLPAHTTGGGDGGNATEDRLAQMSAQIAADRDM